jgi:hypothetical protein
MQHFFLLETSHINLAMIYWRSTSLVDIDSKLMTKLSKNEGRLMRSNMYTSLSSIFISMEHNWSISAFTMLMCASKSSPSYTLMLRNFLWRNNLFPMGFIVGCSNIKKGCGNATYLEKEMKRCTLKVWNFLKIPQSCCKVKKKCDLLIIG